MSSAFSSLLRPILRHRLVHFLAVGGALAAVAPAAKRESIVIDGASLETAVRGEQARRGRALSPEERAAVVSALVDDAVLAREAERFGIGLDDPVIRARLAERMRAHMALAARGGTFDDAETFAESTRLAEVASPRLRLAVWFVARERRDAARVADDLARELAALPAGERRPRGDRPPIPDGACWTEEALARVVGVDASRVAFATEVGETSAPVAAAWGHFVFAPLERRAPTLEDLRAQAVASLEERRSGDAVARLIARARRDYRIDLRSSPVDAAPERATGEPRARAASGVN